MSEYCQKDEKGNYIDIITNEIIPENNLIKFKQNGIEFCFDFMTLGNYKIKGNLEKYMNPYTKQELPEDVVKEIEYKLSKYSYTVTLEYFTFIKRIKKILLIAKKEFLLEDILVNISVNTEDDLTMEQILISKIMITVNGEKEKLGKKLKLGKNTNITLKPPRNLTKTKKRVEIIRKKLDPSYGKYFTNINKHLENIFGDFKNTLYKFLVYEDDPLQKIKTTGFYFVYMLIYYNNFEGYKFFFNINYRIYNDVFYDMVYVAFNKNLVKLIKNLDNPISTKNLILDNQNFRENLLKLMENKSSLIDSEILNTILLTLEEINFINISTIVTNFLNTKIFIDYIIDMDYKYIAFTLFNNLVKLEEKNKKLKDYVMSII